MIEILLQYGSSYDPRFGLLAGLLYLLVVIRDRFGDLYHHVRGWIEGPPPTAIEQLQEEYQRGELTLTEFERRAELALDDRAAAVRDRVEAVDGVGPERSAAIAERFGNVEAIRRANVDEIEDVHGVGPSTARAVREEFRYAG